MKIIKIIAERLDCRMLSAIGLLLGVLIRPSHAVYCEPVEIAMCKDMPWNMTRMPNLVHHSTQENAILAIEPYQQLVNASCSQELVFFLCAMFAPMCTAQFTHESIPPCRGVCQRARAGCEPLMLKHNVSWPKVLDCEQLPRYEKGVCISPQAMVSSPMKGKQHSKKSTNLSSKTVIGQLPDCKCKKTSKRVGRKTYLHKKFHYAIRATFKSAEGIKGGPLIITVHVDEVLKSSQTKIPSNTDLTLWSAKGCICPILKPDREYLILGYEDPQNFRLLFHERCLAVPWKKSWSKYIEKWEAKLLKQTRRKKNKRKKAGRAKKARTNKNGNKKGEKKRGKSPRKNVPGHRRRYHRKGQNAKRPTQATNT